MKKAIVIENLTKTYGALKAVDNISFYVEEGSLFAFLGPNHHKYIEYFFKA